MNNEICANSYHIKLREEEEANDYARSEKIERMAFEAAAEDLKTIDMDELFDLFAQFPSDSSLEPKAKILTAMLNVVSIGNCNSESNLYNAIGLFFCELVLCLKVEEHKLLLDGEIE